MFTKDTAGFCVRARYRTKKGCLLMLKSDSIQAFNSSKWQCFKKKKKCHFLPSPWFFRIRQCLVHLCCFMDTTAAGSALQRCIWTMHLWLDYAEPPQVESGCTLSILGPDSLAFPCSVSKKRNTNKCFCFLHSLPNEGCFSPSLEFFPGWSCRLRET